MIVKTRPTIVRGNKKEKRNCQEFLRGHSLSWGHFAVFSRASSKFAYFWTFVNDYYAYSLHHKR